MRRSRRIVRDLDGPVKLPDDEWRKCHIHLATAVRNQQTGWNRTVVGLGIVSAAAESLDCDTDGASAHDIDYLRRTSCACNLRPEGQATGRDLQGFPWRRET